MHIAPTDITNVHFPTCSTSWWMAWKALGQHYEEDLRYEASFYSPINSLLTHVFPLHQQFMVKPQPKLHPVAGMPPLHSEAESGGQVSVDSVNNVVQSRKAGRVSTDEPDFNYLNLRIGVQFPRGIFLLWNMDLYKEDAP